MQNNHFVQERQIKIMHGPGREPASGEYSCGLPALKDTFSLTAMV